MADTPTGVPAAIAADIVPRAGSAARWTLSARLDFVVLWLAIELTTAEVAEHMGLSKRHLRRLRTDMGLESRSTLFRLDRKARRRLVAFEDFLPFMSLRGQALLRVAQERRRVHDEARDATEAEAAKQRWLRRRTPPESVDAGGLWSMYGRAARAGRIRF